MNTSLPQHDVVLWGIGHTNAHILRMWRMDPVPNARLTCITDFRFVTYSGMLPGTLAGMYEPEQMQIDLVRLCAASGARLLCSEVTGLNQEQRTLSFRDRPPLSYDILSIGVGSRPGGLPEAQSQVLSVKPMQTFLGRLDERLKGLKKSCIGRPWQIAVVGAGAGGVEVALCLRKRLTDWYDQQNANITLIERGASILANMPSRTRALTARQLQRSDIKAILGREVMSCVGEAITLEDGQELPCDLIVWTTSASPQDALRHLSLSTDERGFLLVRSTLQSIDSDNVFVVGDCASLVDRPLAKAGVYAVRQGPILWKNIRRRLESRPLVAWKPQKSFMTLLNTGNEQAILTYRGIGVHARWCWRLKDYIDRRFMAKYQDYRPMVQTPWQNTPVEPPKMYCGGCGSKLPSNVLSRVLSRLENASDDVAVIESSANRALAATVDFFTSFIDDPFLLGQVAALNALSDMIAKGVQSRGALALATLPHGPADKQESYLSEMLEGAMQVLRPEGIPLIGGHTTEGDQAMLGFTILGEVEIDKLPRKGALRPGDQLVLTKPLGTGVLLAANMQAECRHDWYDSLVQSMLTTNRPAGTTAGKLGVQAVTDVTGFGLAGHLLEMLEASDVSAKLSLSAIPLLPGVEQLLASGLESSLAPGNRACSDQIAGDETLRSTSRWSALFDPQTSGGLLMGVPAELLDSLRDELGEAAFVIGEVVSTQTSSRESSGIILGP